MAQRAEAAETKDFSRRACATRRVLPGCQDTGTAIVVAKKGQFVFTDGEDEQALAEGAYLAYTRGNLRYSQVKQGLFSSLRRSRRPTLRG